MYIDYFIFFYRMGQFIWIVCEFYIVLFDDIVGFVDGSCVIVVVFGNMIFGFCYNEVGVSRDIEGIFFIIVCVYNVNRGVSGKVYRYVGGE